MHLLETETFAKQQDVFRNIDDGTYVDASSKNMVDSLNKDRLNAQIDAYNNLKQALPSHKPDHNKFHLESTYKKDYEHPYPEKMYQKSEKMVNF